MFANRIGAIAVVLGFLTACGISENQFPKEYAAAVCNYADKCEKSFYNEEYDGRSDCRDDVEDDFDLDDEFYDECEFDPEKARACIRSIEKATKTCDPDDFDDDCEEIWECDFDGSSPGGGEAPGGPGGGETY